MRRRAMTNVRDHLVRRAQRLAGRELGCARVLDRGELREDLVGRGARVDLLDAHGQCRERPLRPRARALR